MMTYFRYLGRVISIESDNWLEVARNLSWARAVWRRITRILSREKESPRVSGLF